MNFKYESISLTCLKTQRDFVSWPFWHWIRQIYAPPRRSFCFYVLFVVFVHLSTILEFSSTETIKTSETEGWTFFSNFLYIYSQILPWFSFLCHLFLKKVSSLTCVTVSWWWCANIDSGQIFNQPKQPKCWHAKSEKFIWSKCKYDEFICKNTTI